MLEVNWTAYSLAAERWVEVTEGADYPASFYRYLGRTITDPPDKVSVRRIRLLNGPHYRAIIKAYLARTNHV